MGCIRNMFTCIFLLALIGGHAFLLAQGRQLKALNKETLSSVEDQKKLGYHDNETKDSMQKGSIPTKPGRKEFSSPTSPNTGFEVGNTLTASTDDFRPTSPGNSPGVGHKSKEEDQQQAPSNPAASVSQSLASSTDDFRPTGPGRSPGVGHVFKNTKGEPNV